MVKKSYSIYKYIIYKWLLAFAALMAMQVLFLVANQHIFRPENASEWLNILWGNVVFGAATVSTFLLPYLILMLIPGDFRWKKGCRIAAETLYLVPMLFVLITRGADSAYFQYTYRMLSNEIFTYLGNSGPMEKLIPNFMINYWYAWVFGIAIIVAFLLFNRRLKMCIRDRFRPRQIQ